MPFLIGTVLITLMSMITSVCTPYITEAFGLTARQAPWINSVNTLSTAILAPLLGWVGDRHGLKRQLLIGILCVFISNAMCALVQDFAVFCVGRFLNGIGLAATYPAAMSYISGRFPPEKKIGGFAILGVCTCFGSGGGPTLIGLLLSLCTWRQLFIYSELLAVPLFLYVLLAAKKGDAGSAARRLDVWGMALLSLGIGSLLSLLTLSTQLSWRDPIMPGLLLLSAAGLVGFFRHEKCAAAPIMDISLLLNRRFIVPALVGLFVYGVKCYCCTAVPYYFSLGLGKNPALSGCWLTVYFLAGSPLSFFVGRLNLRFRTQTLAIFGVSTWIVGIAMLSLSTRDTEMWYYFAAAVIPSFGTALLSGMPNAWALQDVPAEKVGVASGTISTLSNLGSALISALVVPYLSVFGRLPDGTPDYVTSFPKTSAIMLALLAFCLLLAFLFPNGKNPTRK